MPELKLFISYSDFDRNKMKSLERIIKKNGILTPIIVANNRQASTQLTEKVKNGIESCEYFIPIFTQNSIKAQWLNQEVGYAEAKNKKIRPIIEKKITDKLRGFIHKQLDLPYQFKGNPSNKNSEASRFYEEAKKLINDILIENKITPISPDPENFFPGNWNCIFSGRLNGNEIFEIRDKNKYYIRNKHWFNIEEFKVDERKRKISFIKVGLPENRDTRRLSNNLNIIEIGIRYEGDELPNQKVVYQKI